METIEPNKELMAATLAPMVLSILAEEESYGYAIIQKVKALSGGMLDLNEGTLYPVLRKLEERGLVETEWRQAEGERRRKYYRLRGPGRTALASEQSNWNQMNQILQTLWKLNPGLS